MGASPDEHHRDIGEMENQVNQPIEIPQIQYTDKVADKSVAVQRQVLSRTTETKAPEYIGAVAGKYPVGWTRPSGDAGKDVQGEILLFGKGRIRKALTLSLMVLDDVADDAFKVESDKTNVSLTIASVAGKQRIFKLTGLVHETTGVKVAQKKGNQTVSLKLVKEEKTWHKLLDDRQHATQSSTHCLTKEAVADDTARSNTDITSRVSQTIL